MIYLLIGDKNLIYLEEKKIISTSNIDSLISTYDLDTVDILTIINDLNTYNLLYQKKIVIVNNISKLSNDKLLIDYLNNPSDNLLILTDTTKLDERKKITTKLYETAKVIDLNNIDLFSYVKELFNEYKVDNASIRKLIEYTSGDYNRILNEVEKLKLYRLDTKEISKDDILSLVTKDLNTNCFYLIDYIDKKDKSKMLKTYYDLIQNEEDESKIIGALASNFRLLYRVKYLMNYNSKNEIIKILGSHPYAVSLAIQRMYNYSYEDIETILQKLSNLDIKIKKGLIDKKLGMELFLLDV